MADDPLKMTPDELVAGSWHLTLYWPTLDFRRYWRLRDLPEERLDAALKEIFRGVRVITVTKATNMDALEIRISSQPR